MPSVNLLVLHFAVRKTLKVRILKVKTLKLIRTYKNLENIKSKNSDTETLWNTSYTIHLISKCQGHSIYLFTIINIYTDLCIAIIGITP